MTATASHTLAGPQPLLFADLPERMNDNRRRRRAASKPAGETAVAASGDAPPPAVAPPVFEPAAMNNSEMRAFLNDLPDARLAFLIGEAARELKRRVAAPVAFDGEDAAAPPEPNAALLHAAAAAAAELSGEDDAGFAAFSPTTRRPAAKRTGRAGF